MLDIRLAKSRMENEEGLNHLWVLINPISSSTLKHATLTIHLPDQVHRLENLNGYFEDEEGSILLGSICDEQNIFIEFYTQQEVPCEKTKIGVHLVYQDSQNQTKEMISSIPLHLVTENEMDDVKIDKDVITQLKKLNETITEKKYVETPIKTQYVSNQISQLEKRYRIDYTF